MAAATGVQNPHRFGRYVLIDRLGKGGMAEVFRAIMPGVEGFRRDLVIKQIRPDQSRARNFIEMFVHEARISALLHHPNIVQVFDFGQVDGCYFLAMELLRGRDLLGVMKALRERRRPFPIPIAIHIAQQVALGLAYAHGLTSPEGKPLDILHRDVSPSNIMCLSTGGVKLLDFGIASAIGEGDTAESEESTFKGKLSYMAPERLGLGLGGAGAGGIDGAVGERLEPKLDGRIDLFSLGTVLWEVLAGRRLFQGKTDADKLRAVLEKPIPPPSSLRGDIPPRLDEIVLKALERDRDKRYLTGQSLADDLEDLAMDTKYQSRMLPMLLQDLFGVGGSGTHLAISALPAELLCPPVVLSAAASATPFTGAGAGAGVAPLALAGAVAPASATTEARSPSPIDEAVPAAVSMNVSAAEMSGPPTPMPPSAKRAPSGASRPGEAAPTARSTAVEPPGVATTGAPGEARLAMLAWRWPSASAPRLLVAGAAIGLAVALTGFGLSAVFSRSGAVVPTIAAAHGTAGATGPVAHAAGAGHAMRKASGTPATAVSAPEPSLATLAARREVDGAGAPAPVEIPPAMSSVSPPGLGTLAPAPLAMATVTAADLGSIGPPPIGPPPADSARQSRPAPSRPAPTGPSANRSASARPSAPRPARPAAPVPARPSVGHQAVARPAPAHPAPLHPVGKTLAALGSTSPGTPGGQAVPKTDGRVEKGLSIDPFAEAASRLTRRAQ